MVDLVIAGIDFPPYSIRGVTQTIEPIEAAAQMARTVNGKLLDMSSPQLRKFTSSISCADQQPPAFAFPGALVTVDCVYEFGHRTGVTPIRAAVPGSERIEGGFTFYRPRLVMRVKGFSSQKDEMGAIVSWSLSLEED